ncbi:MAG TPA: glycosyltransferase family 39 protein [Acidimicrobiales bacterium]|nr:glycosyltransferase family 39 protein [Acidimicrobiales bacterium]
MRRLGFTSTRTRYAVVVFAVAFVLRLALVTTELVTGPSDLYFTSDSHEYVALATHLHDGYLEGDDTDIGKVGVDRTPGYPLVVAGVFAFAGRHLGAVMVFQALLGSVTAALTCLLAAKRLEPLIGLLAGLFVAIDPISIAHSGYLLTETVFTFFVLLATMMVLRTKDTERFGDAAAAGGLIAAAAFVRPIAVYMPLAVIPFLLFRRATKHTAVVAATLLVCAVSPIAGWTTRNYVVSDAPVFSSVEGRLLLYYSAASAVAFDEGISLADAQKQLSDEFERKYDDADLTRGETAQKETAMAVRTLAHHPKGAVARTAQGIVGVLFGPGDGAVRRLAPVFDRRGIELLLLVPLGFMQINAIVGATVLWRRDRALLVLFGVLIFYLSFLPSSVGYSRFRVPITPMLAMLAAVGLSSVLTRVCVLKTTNGPAEPSGGKKAERGSASGRLTH